MEQEKRIRITQNALLGQAAGDAFGVPAEFLSRKEIRRMDLREMIGSDSGLNLDTRWGNLIPAGSWSDDTSMTVASMASFVRNGGKIDYHDQLAQFARWWDKGEYCSLNYPFGLGGNIDAAMRRFRRGTPPLECGGKEFMDNGNGALMRILPFSLYCVFNGLSAEQTVIVTGNGSSITHAHEISRMCCFIWTEFLRALSEGKSVPEAVEQIENIPYRTWFSKNAADALRQVTEKRIRGLTEEAIGETGYVADTLYAALYSLCHAENYETSIRNAVNLGYDTDTAAAVTGMAAGILYGRETIPEQWLRSLKKKEYLENAAEDFAKAIG